MLPRLTRGVILAAVALIASMSLAHAALKKITLAHSQQILTPSFAIGSSLPKALGFWQAEGLDVDILPTPGAAAAIQLLVSGKVDVALANPSSAMVAIQRGAPIKIVYTVQRGDIFGVGLPKGMTIADLKGKTVGVSNFASASNNYIRLLLRSAGLEPDKDVSIVEIGTGGRAAAAYKSGQVAAVSLWDEQFEVLAQAGVTFGTIVKDPHAADTSSGALIVRIKDIEQNPKMVIGLARGIAEAQLFQTNYPAETVKLHWQLYPDSAPAKIDDKAIDAAVRVLNTRRAIQARNVYGTGTYGDMPPERMAHFQDYLILVGDLKTKVDVSRYETNALIPEINHFDDSQVLAKAKEVKP